MYHPRVHLKLELSRVAKDTHQQSHNHKLGLMLHTNTTPKSACLASCKPHPLHYLLEPQTSVPGSLKTPSCSYPAPGLSPHWGPPHSHQEQHSPTPALTFSRAAMAKMKGLTGVQWCSRTPATRSPPSCRAKGSFQWPPLPSDFVPVPFCRVNMMETSTGSSLLFSTSQMNTPTGRLESCRDTTQT